MIVTKRCFTITVLLLFNIIFSQAQNIPTPKEHFGFSIGDDYQLATYTQTEAYFKKLDAASDRITMVDIGKTEEGRSQWMLVVTSPENHKNLEKYRSISQKLAHAEDLTEEQARSLAAEGKAVVWIDGGLHATETVGAAQLTELAYQLSSRKDAETMRILDNAIILMVHANPDGQELVSSWYMREPKPEKRSLQGLPRLYEKYAGHDNNRDFFMMNLRETQNMNRQLYIEWLPQIMYNHHQAGPAGSVVAGAPYRDPFNYVFDPLLMTSIDALGAAIVNRLNVENKPGYTERTGSNYSTWYNGGLRTTTYFHNIVGLLTEIIGNPTPSEIPLVPQRLLPDGATPFPVMPQKWKFRQSIDYSISMNYAVLNYAVRYRDELLYNIYKMGKNSIERGSKDHWTVTGKRVDAINTAYQTDQRRNANTAAARGGQPQAAAAGGGGRPGAGVPVRYYDSVMKNPATRDPRGFIIPADQADFATATRFVNALIRTGVLVHKASADFTVKGKKYPAGSYIVKTNQAFRPHVLDMFDPQDHPNDFRYPGGPPIPPYDAAGWTLAYTMGIVFDRFTDDFEGPFQRIPYGEAQTLTAQSPKASAGYVLNSAANNSFVAVNDLLKAGVPVFRIPATAQTVPGFAAGSFFVPASARAKPVVEKMAKDYGLNIGTISKRPSGVTAVRKLRIGLWDTYGGSMPSGWLRFIFEQYHFDAELIYAPTIDSGNLRKKYDVIVFVGGAIPAVAAEAGRGFGGGFGGQLNDSLVPPEYRGRIGRITPAKSIPELKRFLESGGDIVTIGTSTNLAYHLGLPVRNSLVEMVNGQEQRLPDEKFYIPGSVLQLKLDSTRKATWGLKSDCDVYFDESPVFNLSAEAIANGTLTPLAWFPNEKPLRSGWAWGQAYLKGGVTAFQASVGNGTLYCFGPEITFRAQTHGTFKMLFNQLTGTGE
jgi:hypothetical protein